MVATMIIQPSWSGHIKSFWLTCKYYSVFRKNRIVFLHISWNKLTIWIKVSAEGMPIHGIWKYIVYWLNTLDNISYSVVSTTWLNTCEWAWGMEQRKCFLTEERHWSKKSVYDLQLCQSLQSYGHCAVTRNIDLYINTATVINCPDQHAFSYSVWIFIEIHYVF